WLSRLSKITLCQILTSTMNDYPQVIDGIYSRHYEKIYYAKNKPKEEDTLVMVQQKARSIAHQLDNLRPSEQFGRAHEVATQLQALVRSLPVHDHSSFISLFGLIILAQESLLAPTEVRQHIFYHAKLGRTLILEMSSLLKDFKSSMKVNHQHYWSSLNQTESWLSCLEQVCSKLSRYDITWEYRKEYQDVLIIAERYFK
ncbi:uncharacterized protein B0P05DRAFT_459986, partial [Gilbertella persicaria]|uniref:uncharacterized protein n=1 Tax=Gilbertella persicaria TaxID=101096 RepID=UPI00221FD8D8